MKNSIRIFSILLLISVTSSFKNLSLSGDYGNWQTTSCFKGVDFCVRKVEYNEYAKKYKWLVKFRNRYYEDVHFDCKLTESYINSAKGTDRVHIKANSEGGESWFLVNEANSVNLFVNSLRMGKDDWGTNYIPCDR